jgi:hypothetical protein
MDGENWVPAKYHREWAVFDRTSRCYVMFFKTKAACEARCRELNDFQLCDEFDRRRDANARAKQKIV